MSRQGLIPVKRTVTRDGKTFQQTVWIKPKHENKVEHSKTIQVPSWKFHNAQEFQQEIDRINKLRDRSERNVLKEHLMEHIEKDLGVKWDKVPDTDERAFVRNSLRAFSAAKKHLTKNPTQPTTAQAQSQPQASKAGVVTKKPGDKNIMDRDASKKLARDVRDKYGWDKLLPMLKDAGITWDEVSDAGPNRMRALRALASFMRKGGEIGEGTGQTSQPKLVLNNPNQPLQNKSKYEKDSIQYDYETVAKARHKLIGLATGMMPLDDATADFLEKLVHEGKIGTLGQADDYGLPKKLDDWLTKNIIDTVKNNMSALTNPLDRQYLNRNSTRELFEGTPYEKAFEEYKNNRKALSSKWDSKLDTNGGPRLVERSVNFITELSKTNPNWQKTTGEQFLISLGSRIDKAISEGEKAVNELWDDLDVYEMMEERWNRDRGAVLENLLEASTSYGHANSLMREASNRLTPNRRLTLSELRDEIKAGKYSKKDFLSELSLELKSSAGMRGSSNVLPHEIVHSWRTEGISYVKSAIGDAVSNNKKFDEKAFLEEADEVLADMSPLSTPEAHHIAFNTMLLADLQRFYNRNGNFSPPAKFDVVSLDDFSSTKNIPHLIKVHVGAMRQKTDKAKQKYLDKYKNKDTTDFASALKDKVDPETLKFPDASDVDDIIKSSFVKVSDNEAKVVTDKVQATHDRANHHFKTTVHGVYRVKRIACEDKFQKINKDINHAGYYYHGTSFDTAQKILGHTGGFKVFTAKDSHNIKAGSMLGYGIYLASQSSKSMQYVGNGFRSGNRGVLFLCKASLGKSVHTTMRGCSYNQPIMARPDTDSVWMDKPHVVNPEWAVKRAEQAVPRLLIDVERSY